MGWKDLQARVRKLFGGTANSSSRRPDGGTSCYRPIQRRNRQEESLAREKAAEYAAGQPQTPYAHTGFTGMNPPMTGRVPVQSTLTGEPGGFGAPRQGNQTGYARPGQFPPTEPAYSSAGPDNIAYMPGVAMAETGNSFTHVEHIMAITSLQSCYAGCPGQRERKHPVPGYAGRRRLYAAVHRPESSGRGRRGDCARRGKNPAGAADQAV